MPPTRNVALPIATTLLAPPTIDLKNMVIQKTAVTTVKTKVVTLHGVHALAIISDIQTIFGPQAFRPIGLETSLLMIMTSIATHTIVVVLGAALMIDTIIENAITSQLLVIAKAKVTMPKPVTNPD